MKTLTMHSDSRALLQMLKTTTGKDELSTLFGSDVMNSYEFLSKVDDLTNTPMAHLLISHERFVMSPAAQDPRILGIKDSLGYPLLFRLMEATNHIRWFSRFNRGEEYIQELIDMGDKRVDLLKSNAIQGAMRTAMIQNPNMLWLLTDTAKDLGMINKPFNCLTDTNVWKFKFTDENRHSVTLTPMMAILAGCEPTGQARQLANIIYHKHPEVLSLLETYADNDYFSLSYPGFASGSSQRYTSNQKTLVLLAAHYHAIDGKALPEVDGFETLSTSTFSVPGFGNEFHAHFLRYVSDNLDKHDTFFSVLEDGSANSPVNVEDVSVLQNDLKVFEKNMAFFSEILTDENCHYYHLDKIRDAVKGSSTSVANFHNKYETLSVSLKEASAPHASTRDDLRRN